MPFKNPVMEKTQSLTSSDTKSSMPKAKRRKLGMKTGENFLNKPKSAEEPHKKFALYAHKTMQRTGAWKPPLKMITQPPLKTQKQRDFNVEKLTNNVLTDVTNLNKSKENEEQHEQDKIISITSYPISENQLETNKNASEEASKIEKFHQNFNQSQTLHIAANDFPSERRGIIYAINNSPSNQKKEVTSFSVVYEKFQETGIGSHSKEKNNQILDLKSSCDQQVDDRKELNTTPKLETSAQFVIRIDEAEKSMDFSRNNGTENLAILEPTILKDQFVENYKKFDSLESQLHESELNFSDRQDGKLGDKFDQRTLNCEISDKKDAEKMICSHEEVDKEKVNTSQLDVREEEKVLGFSENNDTVKLAEQKPNVLKDPPVENYANSDDLKAQLQDDETNFSGLQDVKLEDPFDKKTLNCETSVEEDAGKPICSHEEVDKDKINISAESSSDDDLDFIVSKSIEKYMNKVEAEVRNRILNESNSSEETVILTPEKLKKSKEEKSFQDVSPMSEFLNYHEKKTYSEKYDFSNETTENSESTTAQSKGGQTLKRSFRNKEVISEVKDDFQIDMDETVILDSPLNNKATFFRNNLNYLAKAQSENDNEMQKSSSTHKNIVASASDKRKKENAEFLSEINKVQTKNETIIKNATDDWIANNKNHGTPEKKISNENFSITSGIFKGASPLDQKNNVQNVQEKRQETDDYISKFHDDDEIELFSKVPVDGYFSAIPLRIGNSFCANQAQKAENETDRDLTNFKRPYLSENGLDLHTSLEEAAVNQINTLHQNLELLRLKQSKENQPSFDSQNKFQLQMLADKEQTNEYRDTTAFDLKSLNDDSTKNDFSQAKSSIKEKTHEIPLILEVPSELNVEEAASKYLPVKTDMASYTHLAEQYVTNICRNPEPTKPSIPLLPPPKSSDKTEFNCFSYKNKQATTSTITPQKFFRTFSDLYADKCLIEDDFHTEVHKGHFPTNYNYLKETKAVFPSKNILENVNQHRLSTIQNMASYDKEQTLDSQQNAGIACKQELIWNDWRTNGDENTVNTSQMSLRQSKFMLPVEYCQSAPTNEWRQEIDDVDNFDRPSSYNEFEQPTMAFEGISKSEESIQMSTTSEKDQEKTTDCLQILNRLIYQKKMERQKKTEEIRNLVSETNTLMNDMIDLLKPKTFYLVNLLL